jgi:molecular chaperone DnaJ
MTELFSFIEPIHTSNGRSLTLNFDKKRVPSKGKNVHANVRLSFEESVQGCTRTIAYRAMTPCSACQGFGYFRLTAEQERDKMCSFCGGTGMYSRQSSMLTINSTCFCCNGEGYITEMNCRYCNNGRVEDMVDLTIEIPAGVMDGMRMIYPGQGDVGEFGGEAGDLMVMFEVETSPQFQRQGDDVITHAEVTFFQATLGDKILVRTIHGDLVPVIIPPGSQPDTLLCMEGLGFTSISSSAEENDKEVTKRGNMYVKLVVIVPKELTAHQTKLLFDAKQKWPTLS